MSRKGKKLSNNNLKNNEVCNLRTPVRRPDNSPQRVKNPGEPSVFDGVGRPGASGDGSPCDTLGIDHHPQAAFRHAEQELEATFWDYSLFFPTQWQWDFGDGSAGSAEQNPVHEYTEPGVYEVCLTVSNANASDTYCEWVEVMVTETGGVTPAGMAVKVYPNPAKDCVVIEPQQRLPHGAFWLLHDALGRELRRGELPEGQPQLVLNLEGLPGGLYFCTIEAGRMARWQGKIVK
jgi:hypothetical protein